MILVDTSVWIDHLRLPDGRLIRSLEDGAVVTHPLVIEELACGHIKNRAIFLQLLHSLTFAQISSHSEVLTMLTNNKLVGVGLGAVDVHLIASAMLSSCYLWSKDKSLVRESRRLNLHID